MLALDYLAVGFPAVLEMQLVQGFSGTIRGGRPLILAYVAKTSGALVF